ncbi:MAG: CHASE2 domain-containing protein [Gammaproteobacteria bacterium]
MYAVRYSQRLSPRHATWIMAASLAIAALGAQLHLQRHTWFERWDKLFLDSLLVYTAPRTAARHTVVVDIDDPSLDALGQWPWPRYRVAELIRRIAHARPAAIGVDVLFAEPDRTSLAGVQAAFKRDFGVDIRFSGVPDGLDDNDGFLGHVLHETGTVAADYFFFDHTTETARHAPPTFRIAAAADALQVPTAPGMLLNTPAIATRTRYRGFINNQIDPDGTLRRVPLLLAHGNALHPSLALATVMRALRLTHANIASDANGPFIELGDSRTRIDDKGGAVFQFKGPPSLYPALSASDVLQGSFDESALAGKVVFVGSSAAGLNDLHKTAVDPLFPGLKVQAAVAENLLAGRTLQTPSWAPSFVAGICGLTGMLMGALFVASRSAWAMLTGTGIIAATLVSGAALLFDELGLILPPSAPLAVVAASFVIFFAARYAIERRRAYAWFKQTENARQVTIESMAAVAETRDPETGAHIKRTQHYVKAIALELRRMGYHLGTLTTDYIELLFASAPLHDIGKVGVPDHILLKPGKLSDDEFELMKRHAEFGRSIVATTERLIEGENFLLLAGEIAATHHEKWDGSGYPLGLAGEHIPLSGRIMAVADVYDALISRRCYKAPFSHEESTRLMREQRGSAFDPIVLDAFFAIEDEIRQIAATYRDEADAASGH